MENSGTCCYCGSSYAYECGCRRSSSKGSLAKMSPEERAPILEDLAKWVEERIKEREVLEKKRKENGRLHKRILSSVRQAIRKKSTRS